MLPFRLLLLCSLLLLALADPVVQTKNAAASQSQSAPAQSQGEVSAAAASPTAVAAPAPIADVNNNKTPRTSSAAAAAGNITFDRDHSTLSAPSSCPPSHLFAPCECFEHSNGARIIRCTGDYNIDLNPIFQRLSIYLPKPDKHFHMFYVNNTNLTYLGNVFHDITFEYIYFDGASALEFIDPNAFDITGPYVKEVRAFNTKLKQKSLEDALLGLSSLLHLTVSNVGRCPPEELLRPCRCEYRSDNWQWITAKFTRFVCGEESEEDLRMQYVLNANRTREQFAFSSTRRLQIYFERLSENLGKLGWQKRFDEFVLQNSPISELPRNLFHDLTFYGVKFDNCPELTAVHPQAFQATEQFIEELYIRRTRLGNERWKLRDTFNAITSLTNLRSLYLIESGLQSVPHHAFRPLKGRFQRKLVKISINLANSRDAAIRQVGSYAFYYLSNLRSIDLSLNSIDKVHKNAFSFRWESTETLEINLAGNNLTDTSIETGAFAETQRPVRLLLGQEAAGNPELRHLDERVFRPLLNENERNVITLQSSKHPSGGNRLSCDCQSRWIFNEFGKIRAGLKDVMCVSNGSWECLPPCLVFGTDLLHCGSNQYFNIEDVFYSLNRNLLPEEKTFRRFVLSNLQIESIPHKSFGDITFEEFELDDCPNLKYVDERAFTTTKDNLTKVVIRNTPQLSEMRFSTFSRLKYLSIKFTGKFRLTDESFKSDLPTETLLKLHLDVDGLLPSSIESNALSYAYRPIHVFLEHPVHIGKEQCKLLTLEEEIYAPFLAVNPDNKIRVNSCPILCDCSIKWLFDAPKDWWMRVEAGDSNIGLQCDDQRSLYFYSDYDFRSCPKTNLLKYFVPESASKLSPASGGSGGSSSSSSSGSSSPYSGGDSTAVVEGAQKLSEKPLPVSPAVTLDHDAKSSASAAAAAAADSAELDTRENGNSNSRAEHKDDSAAPDVAESAEEEVHRSASPPVVAKSPPEPVDDHLRRPVNEPKVKSAVSGAAGQPEKKASVELAGKSAESNGSSSGKKKSFEKQNRGSTRRV